MANTIGGGISGDPDYVPRVKLPPGGVTAILTNSKTPTTIVSKESKGATPTPIYRPVSGPQPAPNPPAPIHTGPNGSWAGEGARNNQGPGYTLPNYAAAAKAAMAKVSGGGNSATVAPVRDQTVQDILGSKFDQLYASLLPGLNENKNDTAAAEQAIRQQYANTMKTMYDEYMNSRNDLAAGAKNLGVTLDGSTIGNSWDANLRDMKNMSNSNLNSDMSFFQKMGSLRDSQLQDILAGVKQDKIDQIASAMATIKAAQIKAAAARSSGGSGSSGGNTVTSTQTQNDPGFQKALAGLSPDAAAYAMHIYQLNRGNPDGAVSQAAKDYDAWLAAHPHASTKNDTSSMMGEGARVNMDYDTLGNITQALQAMLGISNMGGNVRTVNKIVNKAKG